MPAVKKFVIAGLDNSGKTSILLSLQGVSNLLSFYSLKPTLGLNIEQVASQESETAIWELGGQEEYRKAYLEQGTLAQYFEGMLKFLFVIDIQDPARYPDALQYVKELAPAVNAVGPEEIICFIHKFDPDIHAKPEFSDEKILTTLVVPFRNAFQNPGSVQFFKSTIFTVFQKSRLLVPPGL